VLRLDDVVIARTSSYPSTEYLVLYSDHRPETQKAVEKDDVSQDEISLKYCFKKKSLEYRVVWWQNRYCFISWYRW
jgi:hypothetical protein